MKFWEESALSFELSKLFVVIMAGGKGERLWPADRRRQPKQLLPLWGERTMIEETVLRLFPLVAPERIIVITNCAYVAQIQELLPIPKENVIGEPEGRDTAPCVALATALVRRREPDATLVFLPADHVIRPAKLFQKTLISAAQAAQCGALVTLGIMPTSPTTGYGYLELGDAVGDSCHKVLAFKEKPDVMTAEKFFRDGNYRWNSGIFIGRSEAILSAFARYVPALAAKLESWVAGMDFTRDFAECEAISFDYAVMEKAENVLACDVSFYWNDLGSWSALRSILPLDEEGNAVRANAAMLDSANNVVINDGDELIGLIGVHEFAVIKAGNGILVCPLSEEQKVKKLIPYIKAKGLEYL